MDEPEDAYKLRCSEMEYDELSLELKVICAEIARHFNEGTPRPNWLRERYLIAYNTMRDKESEVVRIDS